MPTAKRTAKSTDPDLLALATRTAPDLAGVLRRLDAVAALFRATRSFRVTSHGVGAPISAAELAKLEGMGAGDETDDEEEIENPPADFPGVVKEWSATFNGLWFSWATSKGKKPAVFGGISIASASQLQGFKHRGEGGSVEWVVDQVGECNLILVGDGEDGLGLINGYDGYFKADNLRIEQVLNIVLDHLGIENWELALYSEERTEQEELELKACRAQARAVWAMLGAEVPEWK